MPFPPPEHTHAPNPVHLLTTMTVFLPQYLITQLSVFLPLLTAPLICHSNTKQLHNYTTTEHQTLEKEISNITGHVPLRIYATCKNVRHRGCTGEDVCHWGYMQHLRMCATGDVHVRMCATEDTHNISEYVPLRIYATYQDVCHWGYMQHVRMCTTGDVHVRMCATENICNISGCVPISYL